MQLIFQRSGIINGTICRCELLLGLLTLNHRVVGQFSLLLLVILSIDFTLAHIYLVDVRDVLL